MIFALLAGAPLAEEATVEPTTPTPAVRSIDERYALADRYMRDGIDKLIVDRDMHAEFTLSGTGIILRRGAGDARAIRFYDVATGVEREIVTESQLAGMLSQALAKPVKPGELGIEDPDFDPKTGEFRFRARGKHWVVAADRSLRQGVIEPEEDATALSPDGRFRIEAKDFNLYATEVKSGREVQLTRDGTRERPYGRGIPELSQILREGTEDPKMPASVRWSPDGKRILTWRLDTTGVIPMSMTQANPPGSFYPRSFHYIYPLAGAEKLPQASRLVIDVEAALRKRKAVIVPIDAPSESLLYPADPDMGWLDGKPYFQWTERGYKQLVIYQADPETGATKVLAREKVDPVVTVTSTSIQPVEAWKAELAVSERSGWAQLYLVTPDNPDGGKAITHGNWEVLSVDHIDEKARTLLFTGIGREADRNPYWRGLYRVGLDGAEPVLLTPEPLDHDLSISHDGHWAIDRMSSPSVPTRTVLRDLSDGHIVVEFGHADPSALLASGFTPPELFTGVAADGTTPIYGMILRPANFDPARKYPVIDNVYTGPTTTQVPTSWDMAVTAGGNSVAQLGAIVVMIDGRGTSRRGQAFRLPAYQNLGEVGLDDHIGLIRQMAAKYPYMDAGRVGVYGGSAGGYDAARFILRRPDFFKVAVASSGNHDLRLDKAWWPEVSMGYADQPTWERNSNMSVAGNLRGHLLLIHGDIDDNVPVTESYRLEKAIIDANHDVDIAILPNTTHRVNQPYFFRKLRDYFVRNLLGETPPANIDLTPAPAGATANK